jgi:hypothetical protein
MTEGILWTTREEVQLLCEFYQDGMSCPQIAEAHGRTEAAILTRLMRLNVLVRDPFSGTYHKVEFQPWHQLETDAETGTSLDTTQCR